jgi:hypothetical protein
MSETLRCPQQLRQLAEHQRCVTKIADLASLPQNLLQRDAAVVAGFGQWDGVSRHSVRRVDQTVGCGAIMVPARGGRNSSME